MKTYLSYKPEVLKKLQDKEMKILSDFHDLCIANNINYFMFAGSAIGVVRHQGFIPWDDDIDICMLREDYDKFVKLENQFSDKYELMTPYKDKKFCSCVIHFQSKNTKFVPWSSKKLKCHLGICIDIFVLDKVPSDEILNPKQLRKTWILTKLLFLKGNGSPIIPQKGFLGVLYKIVCYCAHIFLNLFCISSRYLYSLHEKESQKYNKLDSKEYNAFSTSNPYKTSIFYDEIFPLKKMKFESIEVLMPNDYDKHLTRIFGDYMQIPPLEKRVNHSPYILEFEDREI